MSNDGYRCEIEASAGPAREQILYGRALLLVRVRLLDNDCLEHPQPDAFTDLRPAEARRLAVKLLAAAEDAESQTDQAGFWEQAR